MLEETTRAELGKKLQQDEKVLAACEDVVLLTDNILNSLKLLKKATAKVYPVDENTGELAESILTVRADILSIREEIKDVASDTADEIVKIKEIRSNNG